MSAESPSGSFDDLRPGSVVERYEILERLREEGAAVVFRARHLELPREVALSVLRPDALAGDPRAGERFRESARLVASLDHPAVAPIYSLGETEETVWAASRLLTGPTLADAAEEGLTPAQAAHIVEALADALAEMHEAGIVHRDLRADNVWLVRGRAPLLGPPGVRRSDGRTRTSTGLLLGSAQYLAPEQLLGQDASPASDVFALGALAVTCLTGRQPFAAASLGRLLATRPSAPPPTLEADGANAGAINAAVARAMANDPEHRTRTPIEAAQLLAAAVAELPPAVRERRRALDLVEEKPAPARATAEPASQAPPTPTPTPAAPAPAATAPPATDPDPLPPPRDLTRTDRQRPALVAEAEDRTGPPRWQVVTMVLTAVALPILCFLAGRTAAGDPQDSVAAGSYTVRFDGRWSVADGDVPGPVREALERPAVLRGPGDTLAVAGTLARPGPVADPLRAVARELTGGEGAHEVVALGRRQAVRYEGDVGATGTRFHADVVPTTGKPLAVLCVGSTLDADAVVACGALAAHAELGKVRSVAVRPDPKAAAALGAALNELHNRVSTRQLELKVAKPEDRPLVLGKLRDVYRLALEDVSAARVPAADEPVVADIVAALRRVIAAYDALVASDAGGTARRQAIAAVAQLRRTVQDLDTIGYRVTADGA